ncbi:hypothetical protein NFI96_033458 [Prochilodus magdalenae]|nr:hypothetical protein NFI96_033458 [Prochilodus magdalenae]
MHTVTAFRFRREDFLGIACHFKDLKMWGFWMLLGATFLTESFAVVTDYKEVMYGDTFTIKMPATRTDYLEFTSADETLQYTIWPRGIVTRRGVVFGSGEDRRFTIGVANFNDQGTYTQRNFWRNVVKITKVKVATKRQTTNCVAGETLSIYLQGIRKDEASLKFSNQNENIILVHQGSLMRNVSDFFDRIQVTSSSIEVKHVNVSDVGNYTLFDGQHRKAMIVLLNLVDHHEGFKAGPLMALMLLLGIPAGICCCCRKRIFKRRNQSNATTVVHSEVVNHGPPPAYNNPVPPTGPGPMYAPGYPTAGMGNVPPPADPAYPAQPQYGGQPGIPPNPNESGALQMYTPGYPAPGGSTVHPPPSDPAFPPQPQYGGQPTMPPNPGFTPMMYNAPAASENEGNKGDPKMNEISSATALLGPSNFEDKYCYFDVNYIYKCSFELSVVSHAYNTVEVQYGRQLIIPLPRGVTQLDFMSVDKSRHYTIWSSFVAPSRGRVELMKDNNRRFIIDSVNFDDQGNYNLQDTVMASVTTLKVLTFTMTQSYMAGETLSISLAGLMKEEASLNFANQEMNFRLVERGSPLKNLPFYYEKIKVTSGTIQVSDVNESGKYTLTDSKGRKAMIITLKVTEPRPGFKIAELKYGQELSIKLPNQATTLELTPQDESIKKIIWPSSVRLQRGQIRGTGADRRFVISAVNFDDQGTYTVLNNMDQAYFVTKVKVQTATETERHMAGETLSISLHGLKKEEASLHFSKEEKQLMLVEKGSPVQNLTDYHERIKVTNSSIQLLNVSESDGGKYTLFDGRDRKASVITLSLIKPLTWTNVAIIIVFLLLVAISVGFCYYCKKKRMCKSIKRSETPHTVNSSVAHPPNLCNKTTQKLNSAEYSKLTLLAIPLQWFILLLLSPEVDLPANSVGSLPAPGSGTDVLNSVDQFNMEHRKKLYLLISCSLASCYPPTESSIKL